ncbi:unnamed protein product [Euphydryas editha]|uniref:Reverse transcriptase domain-containing protein n=1 Tax=Euphydryas editha TaxID=104508 RepID=A0AAU9TH68_EUPED|nr:unnamed protein product [Euphydryas editha]
MADDIQKLNEIDDMKIANTVRCNIGDIAHKLEIIDNGLVIITQNIRSVYCNLDDFLVTISQLPVEPDIILLTECWLCSDKPTPNIANYSFYASSRNTNRSDGVIAYFKKTINADLKEIDLRDASCVQIHIKNIILLAIYRSPSVTNVDPFLETLNQHLQLIEKNKNIILMGDININTIARETEQCGEHRNRLNYLEMLGTHGIMMGHNLPTRGNNSLDHVMLKIDRKYISAQVAILNTTVTDHDMVLLHLAKVSVKIHNIKTKTVVDYKGALLNLKNRNLFDLLNLTDPEVLTNSLVQNIADSLKENTCKITITKSKLLLKPWITQGMLRCIRHRDRLWHKLRSNPSNEILGISYRRYRNFCNNLVKNSKRKYDRKLLQDSSSNPRTLWSNIATITHQKRKTTDSSKLLQIQHSPKESVEVVNKFFTNIGKSLAEKIDQANTTHQYNLVTNLSSFVFLNTDPKEVHTVISQLKTTSAPGYDNIPTSFLKLAGLEVAPIISHLVNLCFAKGVFPTQLKESIITPIYKNGATDDVSNYRPISVLPSISKVIEKLINSRLKNYLNKFNLLSASQFGFRTGRSTVDAVEALTSVIIDHLDGRGKCLTVFLDLKKAFDTVSFPILLQKLERIGIRGAALNLFEDYLNNRTQRVKIDGMVSEKTYTTYGVPQGSVLGPTLFLIYINDLCNLNLENTRIFSYADDTALVFTGESWDEVKAVAENGLRLVADWLRCNLLTLNTSKTNYMCFTVTNRTQPDCNFNIKIHNNHHPDDISCTCPSIERVFATKYLGVMVDHRLSWLPHVELVAGRLIKLMWIFKILRHVAGQKLLNQIYYALAQTITTYCITIWGAASKTHLIVLERAQRALLKVIYFKKRQYSTTSLYTTSEVLSVRKLYIQHTILRKHTSSDYNIVNFKKRRKNNVFDTKRTHTQFAQCQYGYMSSFLYNNINKSLVIHPLTLRQCRHRLSTWLKTLDYDQTENLLKIN